MEPYFKTKEQRELDNNNNFNFATLVFLLIIVLCNGRCKSCKSDNVYGASHQSINNTMKSIHVLILHNEKVHNKAIQMSLYHPKVLLSSNIINTMALQAIMYRVDADTLDWNMQIRYLNLN